MQYGSRDNQFMLPTDEDHLRPGIDAQRGCAALSVTRDTYACIAGRARQEGGTSAACPPSVCAQ